MKLFKFVFIGCLVAFFSLANLNAVHAEGGRNGECEDADVGGLHGSGDSVKYEADSGRVVEGVCIKAGNDSFGDGHSEKITDNGVISHCYKISGIGTDSVKVSRTADGKDCKEISHVDIYLGNADSEESDEPEVIEDPKEETQEPSNEEPVKNAPSEEKSEDQHIGSPAVESIAVSSVLSNSDESDNDSDEDEDKKDNDDEDDDDEDEDEEVLSQLTELPQTGGFDILGMIGANFLAMGLLLRKTKFKDLTL